MHLNQTSTNILGGRFARSPTGGFKLDWQGVGNQSYSPIDETVSTQAGMACSQVKERDGQMKEIGFRQREGLRCVYLNARSIKNKVDELMTWTMTWNFDVVAITETWLMQGQEWLLNIPGLDVSFEIGRMAKVVGEWHC